MKILLATVVFNTAIDFLEDFFNSIRTQSYRDFDVLIFNDGLDVKNISLSYTYMLNNNKGYNFAEIRKNIIDFAIDKEYDLLVFADSDDIIGKYRIQRILEQYRSTGAKYSFYYNPLYVFNDRKRLFFKNKMPIFITSINDIAFYNFLGMSNTAINLNESRQCLKKLKIPNNIIAFDWYLHSFLIFCGYKGIKIDAKTYYRIYNSNVAGDTSILTVDSLKTGIKVKKFHYLAMSKLIPQFHEFYKQILELELFLKNISNMEKYIGIVNLYFKDSVFWWEKIKTLDQLKEVDDDLF